MAVSTSTPSGSAASSGSRSAVHARLKKRYASEARFKAIGLAAILTGLAFVVLLFTSIISNGWTAFLQSKIEIPVELTASEFPADGATDESALYRVNYTKLARNALYKALGFEDRPNRRTRREIHGMLSRGVDLQIRDAVVADPSLIGKSVTIPLLTHGNIDQFMKGAISRDTPNEVRLISDQQIAWIDQLVAAGKLETRFNWGLFEFGASSQPETAGLRVAIIGSFFMMLTVIFLAVPIGVAAAAYLEEFAPRNWFTDIIEVNINNLAAVPSIVFGLLGLAVFINFFGMPRSASVIGGLVLTLMTLPTVIIATRAAIRAVPPSIREAALGVGASRMQALTHHILPLALPGILTGTIIGLVQALGETAPLLMIGMVAFVVDAPSTPLEPATALPVQIYMWATSAERGFVERTAGRPSSSSRSCSS
jgi:phosphate transport system permease protein